MRVKSIRSAGRAPVYNLEVEDTHCFAVNGGLIVHNCYDSVRYFCMSRPWTPKPKAPKKPRWNSSASKRSWMA